MADTTRKMPPGITTMRDEMLSKIGDKELDDLKPGDPFPFTPCGQFVAMKVHRIGETRGGIILPDTVSGSAYENPLATVLAVGPDVKQVTVGDLVTANDTQPCAAMKRGRITFTLINEEHLFGVWSE